MDRRRYCPRDCPLFGISQVTYRLGLEGISRCSLQYLSIKHHEILSTWPRQALPSSFGHSSLIV